MFNSEIRTGCLLRGGFASSPTLSHIPVIAVTAHAMVTEQERIFQAGCNACVSKPVDFKVLTKQLHQWLAVPVAPDHTG